jgi:hypothetical protein
MVFTLVGLIAVIAARPATAGEGLVLFRRCRACSEGATARRTLRSGRRRRSSEFWVGDELVEPSGVVAGCRNRLLHHRCGCRVGKVKEVIGAVTGLSSHDPADVALVVVAVLSCGPLSLVGIFEQLQGKKIGLRTPE